MTRTLEAVYENGVLRPLQPLDGAREHSQWTVTLEPAMRQPTLAGCIGIMPDDDAQEMIKIIEEEFEQVDLNEWR